VRARIHAGTTSVAWSRACVFGQQFSSGSVSAMPQESNCIPLDAWSVDHKLPAWDLTLLIAMTRASNIVGESMTRR
jgi:hypothetical protein